ncbi:SemiSWEET family transporter [Ochrovirga pacifica]|uniref:SemiSWEET family transporter n=1 Tax=Ochrovirga pacifica TaxID=1042376 RepID=UPI0002558726|nr:SemiSWEET family transporter [Ochrovirga pacifica]
MASKLQVYLEKHQKSFGFVGALMGIVMFVSLVEVMIANFKGESAIVIQPTATAINGLVWTLYSYGRKDYFLLIPNVLAFVLGIMTTIAAFVN